MHHRVLVNYKENNGKSEQDIDFARLYDLGRNFESKSILNRYEIEIKVVIEKGVKH